MDQNGNIDTSRMEQSFVEPVATETSSPVLLSESDFLEAAENGDLRAIQAALDGGLDTGSSANEEGYHAIHLTAVGGRRKCLRLLLENRKDLADQPTSDTLGHVPLHFASLKGHFAILRDLLEFGANVNLRSKNGATPLHLAACNGILQAVELLVEAGADVNAATETGSTPLISATFRGHEGVVACLLRNNACPYKTNSNGESAITIATKQKRKNVLRVLHAAVFPEESMAPLPPLVSASTPPPPPMPAKVRLGISPSGSTASS